MPVSVAPPPVMFWFKIYIALMAVLYMVCIGLGILFLLMPTFLDADPGETWAIGLVLIGVCAPLAALFLAPLFLKPVSWVWIFDLILIGLGLTSCLTLPATIPLLIFWVKPETQRYFGRLSSPPVEAGPSTENPPAPEP